MNYSYSVSFFCIFRIPLQKKTVLYLFELINKDVQKLHSGFRECKVLPPKVIEVPYLY